MRQSQANSRRRADDVSISAATYQARQTEAAFMAAVKDAAEKLGWLPVPGDRIASHPNCDGRTAKARIATAPASNPV
jgi:hypothetical protein